jgi:VanZ family protein
LRSTPLGRWLPVVVGAAVISLFSSGWFSGERTGEMVLPVLAALFPWASPEQLLAAHAVIRKAGHFLEYLLLSLLLYRALRHGPGWDTRAAGMAVVLAGLYAVGDEFHQWFVPGRTAAATDCLIDVSGAATGQGLLAAWRGGRPAAAR